MKAFNLEEALAGKPVVTRDGIPVSQITKFNIHTGECVVAVVNGCLSVISEPGLFGRGKERQKHLFMAPEKKWVNLYWNEEQGRLVPGYLYPSKEDADKAYFENGEGRKFIQQISFEV